MASSQQTVPPPRRLKDNARHFWHRVSEGLALNQLWWQFEKDARASYRLYSAGLENLQAEPSDCGEAGGLRKRCSGRSWKS